MSGRGPGRPPGRPPANAKKEDPADVTEAILESEVLNHTIFFSNLVTVDWLPYIVSCFGFLCFVSYQSSNQLFYLTESAAGRDPKAGMHSGSEEHSMLLWGRIDSEDPPAVVHDP